MTNSFKILSQNKIFYEYFLSNKILEVKEELSAEELLARIIFLVKFSCRNHAGYYSDGRLENILVDYGEKLNQYVDDKKVARYIENLSIDNNSDTILHVATKLYEAGGHTRIIYQFLKRCTSRKQILILTDQSINEVPQWFAVNNRDIPIITINKFTSMFERAYLLRYISNLSKTVILHHHPYDAVPVIAFSHGKCPPVLLENHAHSWFWLGPSIADIVLTLSNFHKDFTYKTRPVNNVHCFPFTQIDDLDACFNQQDKLDAKARLKLNPRAICIISIGTAGKFIPNAQYNFYNTAKKIVSRFENAELFVIGIEDSTLIRSKYNLYSNRIHFVGTVSDPVDYYKAADICLDSLPQPSLGGTVYSTLIGMACPVFKYGAVNMFYGLNLIDAKLYEQYIGNMKNEIEYLDKLEFLINNPEIRLSIAKEIREDYVRLYSKRILEDNINEMLALANNKKHIFRKIPVGKFYCDADSAEIAETSLFQDLPQVYAEFRSYLSFRDKIMILIRLFSARVHCLDVLMLAKKHMENNLKKVYFVIIKNMQS